MLRRTAGASLPIVLLLILLVATTGYLGYYIYEDNQADQRDKVQLSSGSLELPLLFHRIASAAQSAVNGDPKAFKTLNELKNSGQTLLQGGTEAAATPALNQLRQRWTTTAEYIATILQRRERVLFVHSLPLSLNNDFTKLDSSLAQLGTSLQRQPGGADAALRVQTQRLHAERLAHHVDRILTGTGKPLDIVDQYRRDITAINQNWSALQSELAASPPTGSIRTRLVASQAYFKTITDTVGDIAQTTRILDEARTASSQLATLAMELNLNGSGNTGVSQMLTTTPAAYGATAVLLIGLLVLSLLLLHNARDTRSAREQAMGDKDHNQQAILRVLDELEGLGEGDLTVEVTVTEDFTGSIADAINFAIVQLRELVSRIVDTAAKVAASANNTRGTVTQLAQYSEDQAKEISAASSAITDMVTTIDQVSANAAESAGVAQRSVSIANNGAEVVRSSIQGMDRIREQIQDTAKRIKRLGESSQEIGDIVSLINDIADQTNILSLNAAIQASSAGEAGRGFAVVADEVQRLAERSAAATKQIAALVKTIQTDTNEAVSSMEQTTAEVVSGASLTENAGVALTEIEAVSSNLATLIQDISTAASRQSETAGQISQTMGIIQGLTDQTLDGTKQTSSSVGQLTDMAVELRAFVSGFKLPEGYVNEELTLSNTADSDDPLSAQATTDTPPAAIEPAATNQAEAGPPAHVAKVLSESSAAMRELDAQASSLDLRDDPSFELDEDFAQLEGESQLLSNSPTTALEEELAGIDLGEFDLDTEDDRKV